MSTGHKKWATGDLVEATAFNSYVQNQVVGVYADSSARDAAFGGAGEPTLAEGMVCYLNDTNELQIYSGSAWVPLLDLDTISVSSGAYTIKGNVTVGVDDAGHDVLFYGDTAGSYWFWDTSLNKMDVSQQATSATLTDFTQAIDKSTINIVGDYEAGHYQGMIVWTTDDDNSAKPKAGIIHQTTGAGSQMHFGTSNNYSTGLTNTSFRILESGALQLGEDDTGFDFTVYGDESGSYMMWDASADDLEFFGNSKINLNGTTVGSTNFQINFAESYNILADNTGTGSANSRLWFSGDAGGSVYIGPRAGGSLFEDIFLRADVTVSGALSKGSGSFDIPHPIKDGDWRLRHSFLEGPTCDNIYRGTATISGSSISIDLDTHSNMTDGTWEALNTNPWSMVSSSGNAVTWLLTGKTLTINGPDGAVCSWMVIGERKDDNIKGSKQTDSDGRLITEYENADIDADADPDA